MNPLVELHAPIADLLVRAGIDKNLLKITPCARSGNNRIYRVDTEEGVFAVKQYFRHEGDTRDRLAAEYAFLTYAKVAVPESTPRPYTCDPSLGLALYEFVEGQPFQVGMIGTTQVEAAIQFFRALNAPQLRATAQLPIASETSFTITDHLTLINKRIARSLEMKPQSDVDADALAFLEQLDEHWQLLSESIREEVSRANLNIEAMLAPEQRCISPSDFGFHNALAESNGNIRFLDFEYAGWDDPAKTVGDFFAQLAVSVPSEFYDHFAAACMAMFPESEFLVYRANLLRPVFQVKWCCIALNVFMLVHLARRKFANPGLDEIALKQAQLAKAKIIFQSIQENPWPILI